MGFLSNVAKGYQKGIQNGLKNMAAGLESQLRGKLSSFGISMPIGSLGDIVFEVSSRKVSTFDGMKRTTKAKYGTHEIAGQKPLLEYLGQDTEEISFTMKFSVSWGADPAEEAEKLRELCGKGEAMYLIIGNKTIGDNMWIIESVGESMESVDNSGRVLISEVDVSLKEYVPTVGGEIV